MSQNNKSGGSYADRIRAGRVHPWVGDGVDGCRRSAAICFDELMTMAEGDPRHDEVFAQWKAWADLANELTSRGLRVGDKAHFPLSREDDCS